MENLIEKIKLYPDKYDFYKTCTKNLKKFDDDDFNYCLNYVQENIIFCTGNSPVKNVITELFKRGAARKWSEDNIKK